MKAVKGKHGILCLLSRDESRLFNKIDFDQFVNISNLAERDFFIAEEMYKKNVLRKIRKGEHVGYKIYPQKQQL